METISEMDDGTAFSISSDGTINVAEALTVVRCRYDIKFGGG